MLQGQLLQNDFLDNGVRALQALVDGVLGDVLLFAVLFGTAFLASTCTRWTTKGQPGLPGLADALVGIGPDGDQAQARGGGRGRTPSEALRGRRSQRP